MAARQPTHLGSNGQQPNRDEVSETSREEAAESEISQIAGSLPECPRRESNLDLPLRRRAPRVAVTGDPSLGVERGSGWIRLDPGDSGSGIDLLPKQNDSDRLRRGKQQSVLGARARA